MTSATHRPFGLGMRRGAGLHCPNCGKGKLYRRYLKVAPCPACGHDNTVYPADDAPPYFTILLVGHLVIAPLLLFPWVWEANPVLVISVTLPILAAACLLALPVIKGAVVGLQWALRHTDDPGEGGGGR
jgi:uncharacterized protein (DUF983 family)